MQELSIWTRQHKQSRTGRLIVPVLAAVVVGYFSFHAYHGEYGIYSKYDLEKRVASLQDRLKAVTVERADIEKRTQLLRDGSIEKDMLDEYARRELDYARPDDLVIMFSTASSN